MCVSVCAQVCVCVSTFHMQAGKLLHNLSKTSEKNFAANGQGNNKRSTIVQVAAAAVVAVVLSQVFSAISALLFNFRFWAIVF